MQLLREIRLAALLVFLQRNDFLQLLLLWNTNTYKEEYIFEYYISRYLDKAMVLHISVPKAGPTSLFQLFR